MFEKQKLIYGIIILVAALAVLEFLSPAVMNIDTSTLPGWEAQTVVVIQHFFAVTPVALLAGFGWSIFGFLRYKFGDQTVQYEVTKLYETWTWFEGILVIIAAGLPLPLSIAVSGVIMAVKSVLNTLRAPPAGPGPPKLAT